MLLHHLLPLDNLLFLLQADQIHNAVHNAHLSIPPYGVVNNNPAVLRRTGQGPSRQLWLPTRTVPKRI
ncbi:hypothetical protein D3C81_2116270 [compost metagenome]